ncbi:DNA translocase FtsK [Patescibacteria group bacterium]|nr:DNA translocase FtsK [Patescibacteria group bacterium]MBU1200250.1 DNA translocase FtsK [Patescibacteria group bacterium]MBU1256355.1 DNA translocase FtsK [Patescibacteria group bacterium]MBU1457506.1 DNA translocase FtsK [Patescibacteria group bacterium]
MARKRGRRSKPFKLNLKKDTTNSILAIMIAGIGCLLAVSFSRQGPVLSSVYDLGSRLLGWTYILTPFIFISGGLLLTKVKWPIATPQVFIGSLVALISLAGLTKSGQIGQQLFLSISALITSPGAYIFYLAGVLIGIIVLFETSLEDISVGLSTLNKKIRKILSKTKLLAPKRPIFANKAGKFKIRGLSSETKEEVESPAEDVAQVEPKMEVQPTTKTENLIWAPPPLSLLSSEKSAKADRGDINANAAIIEKTLDSFGIVAKVIEVNQGPAVTQYAIEIALGTKLSKITARQSDLALALAAPQGHIRIEAPIPGRSLVGVEIPNKSLEFVSIKEMLTSDQMRAKTSRTMVSLGLDVAGNPVVVDIAKMPHTLIAGATGSGKSVCINAFIASILFRASPDEVKFIMVDPKRVELTGYNGIPHLLTPVIVDPKKVVNALGWATAEMERRYKLFQEVGVRNIAAYNELSGFQAMPYIIIIIDELADIILIAPNEVEESITRISQMARAVGIHLVLATQRPSVNVITGLIKANIPCRIAFQVTSMIDSRVIIDTPGAEKLLGMGDMLYVPPDQARPKRIQGAFISDKEIKDLITYLKKVNVTPEYESAVVKEVVVPSAIGANGQDIGEVDDLFKDAIGICINNNKASASLLQRRLSIGYARAARIIDQLERSGLVSAPEGNKPREVLIENAKAFLTQNQNEDSR